MERICTTIEQSKKLIELGIDVKTADMWWAERYEGRVIENGQYIVVEEPYYYYLSFIKPSDINYSQDTIKDIPAWSLASLLSIIPKHIGDSVFRMYMGETDINLWFDDLSSRTVDENLPDIIKENFVDVAFEMVVRLKENGKL